LLFKVALERPSFQGKLKEFTRLDNREYNAPMSTARKTARRRSSSLSALFIPVAFFFGIAAGYMLGVTRTPATASDNLSPVSEDDPSQGPENAAVTIVEFSDYQCPYCQMWYQQVLPRLMSEYAGQIRFIYRDFPLGGHPEAQPAAEAANCAGDQDAYWEFQDSIFSGAYGYGRSAYEQYAEELGLDMDKFTSCLDTRKYQAEVLEDYNDALKLGVQSTPTFFINDTQLIGAQPYETFKQMVEAELAKAEQ
jgi:protein-disulfide isomerase